METNRLYRVLLVDDEPLILAGVKQLIDREKSNCTVVGTASRTAEALEKIGRLRPDVVICDIVMPGLSGIDLLKQANAEFPDTVFIMLSNRSEFDLARESLQYQAVEYLVKANLESMSLEKALARAFAECEKRNKLHRVEEADEMLHIRQRQTRITNAVRFLLCDSRPLPEEDTALLNEEGMLSCFAFAFIPLNFAVLPEYPDISEEEQRKIFDWETEIAGRLAVSFFPRSLLLPRPNSGGPGDLLLFAWGLSRESWEADAARFRERLIKTSGQITQLGTDVTASEFYPSVDSGEDFPSHALNRMTEKYYHAGRGTHSDSIQKALQYILANTDKKIMLQDVADYACISPGYLSTLFKREYRQNLVDFINQTKIDMACELLRENKHRINEISFMLGFENAYYFTRVFRRHTGLTPSEFREGRL
jgi:YesN/AraC family two-component response regulator